MPCWTASRGRRSTSTCRPAKAARTEFAALRRTKWLMATMAPHPAPPELALRLKVAISQQLAAQRHHRWESLQVRFENALNAFMFPAAGGLLSAVLFFGLLIGVLVPVHLSAGNDVPTMLYTPPEMTLGALRSGERQRQWRRHPGRGRHRYPRPGGGLPRAQCIRPEGVESGDEERTDLYPVPSRNQLRRANQRTGRDLLFQYQRRRLMPPCASGCLAHPPRSWANVGTATSRLIEDERIPVFSLPEPAGYLLPPAAALTLAHRRDDPRIQARRHS